MITGTAGDESENPASGGGIHGSTAQNADGPSYCEPQDRIWAVLSEDSATILRPDRYANGEMRCGLVVFAFMLVDTEEGDGGFCCV